MFESTGIRSRVAVTALATLLAAAPIATAAGADAPKHGGTLVYGVESEIPWYDPHVVFGGSNKRVVLQIFEGLVDRDRTRPGVVPPLVPRLAESWEVSDDGKVYTFHLRKGVTFHDGTPFNAEAVVFNLRRVIDPDFEYYKEGTDSLRNAPLRHLTEARAVDEHTVELVLSQPWGHFIDQLSTTLPSGLPLMMSPASVMEWGNEDVNLHPVGTGPFKLEEYDPGVKTVLARNEDYWNEPLPYLDRIIFFIPAEASTRVTPASCAVATATAAFAGSSNTPSIRMVLTFSYPRAEASPASATLPGRRLLRSCLDSMNSMPSASVLRQARSTSRSKCPSNSWTACMSDSSHRSYRS